MAEPKVFFIHLRRPDRANPNERRDDPFYEFGSFGCTKCHSSNLFHPRHANELEGARLAFIQGGPLGSRLVFLTPAITLKIRQERWLEARWTPAEKPFKYFRAPIVAYKDDASAFPLIEAAALNTRCPTVESGLSSLFRSRAYPLEPRLASQVIRVYERLRATAAASDLASSYHEALPYDPPKIDRNRKASYGSRIAELTESTDGAEKCLRIQSRCNMPRLRQTQRRKRHCR